MSGYESPTPDDELAGAAEAPEQTHTSANPAEPELDDNEGGDRTVEDADELQDPAAAWSTLEAGAGLRHPKTHENWHVS